MKAFKTKDKYRTTLCFILFAFVAFIFLTSIGGCKSSSPGDKDTISELSFSHDGKKVVLDRCRADGCQIQVYDLETGELAAYQSPKGERWTMGKYSYDGKQIAFSVIPRNSKGNLELNEMQIAVMDADGKNFKKVTTGPGAKLYPAFSHSGKKVLYACASHIRESGRTAAADYDAWEVDLETGRQTQLTFFGYFYMSNLTYYPDDTQFIYYGERPSVFEGIKSYGNEKAFGNKMIELESKGMGIHGVVVMRGQEMIRNPYRFPPQTFPQKPLLSQDGSVMIYEKSHSGDFYLYSEHDRHKFVHRAGSVDSVTISPDGEYIGICRYDSIVIINISTDAYYRSIFLRRSSDWDQSLSKMPHLRLMPKMSSNIIKPE